MACGMRRLMSSWGGWWLSARFCHPMSCFLTICALAPVCKAISSQGYPMKAQFSAHPKQDGSKKSTEKRQNGRQRSMEGKGGRRENGGSIFMGPWVAGSPVSRCFLGEWRATGPVRRRSGRYRRPTRVAIWRLCDGMKGRGALAQGRGTAVRRPLSRPVANKVSKQKAGERSKGEGRGVRGSGPSGKG